MSAAAITIEPHTEIGSIPAQVSRLRQTFESGRTRPLEWRRQQLKQLIAMHDDHADEFIVALHDDFGKPTFEAFTSDVGQGKMEAKSALKNLKKWTRPERIGLFSVLGKARVLREPLGVVLIISPWNYPVGLLLSPLVGAIAAGSDSPRVGCSREADSRVHGSRRDCARRRRSRGDDGASRTALRSYSVYRKWKRCAHRHAGGCETLNPRHA